MKSIISYVLLFLMLSCCVVEMEGKRKSKALMTTKDKESAISFIKAFMTGILKGIFPIEIPIMWESIQRIKTGGFKCDLSFIKNLSTSEVSKEKIDKIKDDLLCENVKKNDECIELLKQAYKEKKKLWSEARTDPERDRFENQMHYLGIQIDDRKSLISMYRISDFLKKIKNTITPRPLLGYLSIIQKFFGGMGDCLKKNLPSIYELIEDNLGLLKLKLLQGEELRKVLSTENILKFFTKSLENLSGHAFFSDIVDFFYAEKKDEKAEIGGKILGKIIKTVVFPVKKKKK